jgi:malate dehydrogenase
MVEAILKDQKKILPCAALCEGEYGCHGLFMGVPVKLGDSGVEEIVEYDLTTEERTALSASGKDVQELCETVNRLLGKN